MTWVLVALIGVLGGVVSGLFGVGGAIVIVPALVLLVKLPPHTASGTSLAALLLPVGVLGAIEYHRRGQGDRKSTRLYSSHSPISYAVFCLHLNYLDGFFEYSTLFIDDGCSLSF